MRFVLSRNKIKKIGFAKNKCWILLQLSVHSLNSFFGDFPVFSEIQLNLFAFVINLIETVWKNISRLPLVIYRGVLMER